MFDSYIKKRNSSGKYLTRSQACVNDLQYSIQSLRNLFSCLSNRNPIFSCDADQDYCCRSNLQKKVFIQVMVMPYCTMQEGAAQI